MATNPEDLDLLIDRAVHAVRELAVPNGPPANVVEKVRLAGTTGVARHSGSIDRAQSAPDPASSSSVAVGTFSLFGANVMRPRNLVAVAAAGLLIVLATQWLPIQHNGNFAFAQVQEQVGKTTSVQYTETPYGLLFDDKHPTVVAHVKILGNRVMRNEIGLQPKDGRQVNSSFLGPWGTSIEITDLDKKKKATLYPEIRGYMSMDWGGTFAGIYMPSPKQKKELEEKEAAARKEQGTKGSANTFVAGGFDWDSARPDPRLDIYELIRHVPTDRAKKLDEKTINGKRVVGFIVEQDEHERKSTEKWHHTWWVDPTTKLPVQLEISWGIDDSKHSGSAKVVSDIVFDAPLDPALFSIDVPPGYIDLGPLGKKAMEQGQAVAQNSNRMVTVQFTQLEHLKTKDGRTAPELVKRVMILDNHLKREEVTIQPQDKSAVSPPDGIVPHVSIQDAEQRKTIILLSEKKKYLDPAKTPFTADYIQWAEDQKQRTKRAGRINVYAALDFPDEKAVRLPLKSIDGHWGFGKHVEEVMQRGKYVDTREWTFWFDPFTMHWIRGEGTLRSTDPSIGEVDYVLRDFLEHAPVDKALFSTDPPPGWTSVTEKPARNIEPSSVPGKSGG
jgi:hypothetical protein